MVSHLPPKKKIYGKPNPILTSFFYLKKSLKSITQNKHKFIVQYLKL